MQPLRGVVVVAVEQAVSAPICTRHLGDMGARVIKVENRAGGDSARDYDDAEWMGYALNHARYAGVDIEPNGMGSPAVAPYGAYPTADGQTLVLGTTND